MVLSHHAAYVSSGEWRDVIIPIIKFYFPKKNSSLEEFGLLMCLKQTGSPENLR